MEKAFVKAKTILEKLHTNGYEAYFVGGAVRDMLLKRPIGDIDIATSALPTEIMRLFPRTIDVGVVHGTVIVLHENEQYEVTTFRTEDKYKDFRRPSQVEFVKSLHEDLKRRDFTMNAIALTIDGEMIDPFQGRQAIANKYIQTVGIAKERFNEDALRMMRAIRFQSQLGFTLSEETKLAILANSSLLKNISVERITIEFEKLLRGQSCQTAIPTIIDTALYRFLPGLEDMQIYLSSFSQYMWYRLKERAEYWTLVCYLLHINKVDSFLRNWKLPTKIIEQTTSNLLCLETLKQTGWTKRTLYDYGMDCIQQVERIIDVIGRDKEYPSPIDEYKRLLIKKRTDIEITGNDLIAWFNQKPGKWISDCFERIENAILENKLDNNKEKIKEWLLSCNQK
ncbi:CCA tRNA nucleotidyltransferase [Fredinandcohnia humi]